MLSAEQLVLQNIALQKSSAPSLSRGLKDVTPVNDANERAGIRALQDDLFQILNQQRIERVSVRSQATFLPHQESGTPDMVQVTRKMGKWNQFGHVRDGVLFLHPHEALHLIEINRLELYFHSVLVSLEQAFALLLGANALTPESYFVYSQLMRAGYVVELHDNGKSYNSQSKINYVRQPSAEQNIVWACLQQLLTKSGNPLQSKNPHIKATAMSMKRIADRIRSPQEFDQTTDLEPQDSSTWPTSLKPSLLPSRKRSHAISFHNEHKNERFLDTLLDEPNVREFTSIFRELQVIQLTALNDTFKTETTHNHIEIVFDLFAANADHRKSNPAPPTHRIVVCTTNADVPTRHEILRLYTKLAFRTPILVIFVNELMSMQAYVYVVSS